jgi:hypothetical protein
MPTHLMKRSTYRSTKRTLLLINGHNFDSRVATRALPMHGASGRRRRDTLQGSSVVESASIRGLSLFPIAFKLEADR